MLNFKTVNSVSVVLLIGFIVSYLFFSFPFYGFILLFLAWITLTTIGSFNILWNYFLKAYHNNPHIKTNSIAITFDDGPHPEITPKILTLLKKHQAKATFFCIGKHIAQHPEIAKQIDNDGHLIGNHSYHHNTNFGFLNHQQVIEEITQTDTHIYNAINKKPLLFRPPFGVTNPSIAKAIKATKHNVIGWNVRSLDTAIKNEDKILNRITKNLQKGDVILLHDTSYKSLKVLEQLLLFMKEKNYTSIRIDELLKIKSYE